MKLEFIKEKQRTAAVFVIKVTTALHDWDCPVNIGSFLTVFR